MTRPEVLILVHGDPEGMNWIKAEIQEKLPDTKIIIPKLGEEYKIGD